MTEALKWILLSLAVLLRRFSYSWIPYGGTMTSLNDAQEDNEFTKMAVIVYFSIREWIIILITF